MKESINKIYNALINYLIDFFHVAKKRFKRCYKKIRKKLRKFYYYEILGVIVVSVYLYRFIDSIYNLRFLKKIRLYIVLYYKKFKRYAKEYYSEFKEYLSLAKTKNKERIDGYRSEYSKYMTPRIMAKSFVLVILSVFLIYDAYSWFYNEYVSKGTEIKLGTVEHVVNQYDKSGVLIGTEGDTVTVVRETDLSNTFKNTRYIEIKNTGSLNIDYNLSFTLDGTMSNAGVLYYRVIDITDEVLSSTVTATNDTKLKAYAASNPTPDNLETDALNPVSNLTTIPQIIIKGEIDKDKDDDENNYRYYRIDYGMYQNVNSSLYSGASVSVHANVYCTQRGIDASLANEGQIWLVENESQFRDAALNALSGDTIKLADDIKIDGSVDFQRRVHLDTAGYNLHFTGDLVYDFVEMGKLNIDTSSGGKIDVDGNLYINTPKSQIHIVGLNQDYDIFVGKEFTVNGIQNEEEDGVLLEAVRIVKNKVGNIPVDIIVESNTRLTIAPNVEVGYVIGADGSTNIEILNNGTITQIQLQNMKLIDSFSKYQIYVYNLNTILGVLNGPSIMLPSNSTPYTGPNTGNTLIIRGVSSNNITVGGSDNFTGDDINQGAPEDSVIPIQGEENSYYVYIRDNNESLEKLLKAYFDDIDPTTTTENIYNIKKLIIYTLNSAYFENEDFTYIASDEMHSIEYLGLANATVSDGTTINKIANNTLKDKTSIKTLILSKTLTTIGSNAFANVNLGRISTSKAFTFLSIPSTVTNIGDGAFANARYVKFEGQIPPTIGSNTFNDSSNGTKFFVSQGAIETFRNTKNINEAYVYYHGELSDNKQYFVYDYGEGYGISYFINSVSVGSSIAIPNNITKSSVTKTVTALGYNSYRNLNTAATGTKITIPNTVSLIDSYAFYKDNITEINLGEVSKINSYAFYDTKLTTLVSNKLKYIGSYGFYQNPITYISLPNVDEIMSYAFMNSTTLYEMDLGAVKVIGDKAFYNCPQLGRVWFSNISTKVVNNGKSIDLTVGEDAVFTNWGMYLDGRLRVYVPSGTDAEGFDYLEGYKKIFAANESFVYPKGTIIGSYKHVAIPYDWGEYSVRGVTKKNAQGEDVTAYEIIEYHGADLTSSYQIPDVIVSDEGLSASITGNSWQNGSGYRFGGNLTITNNTTATINDWTVRINLPTGVTWGSTYAGANENVNGNLLVLSNKDYNGTIDPGGSIQLSFYYDMSSQSLSIGILSVYSSTSPLMNIISVGEYAYRHTASSSNQTIDLLANNLINIDNHGLENIKVKSLTSESLISIGDYSLYNTGLQTVDLPNLNSMGKYAMSDMDTLYSVNLGNIQVMGENAISNNPNLEQIFIGTTNTDNMSVHSTAMNNIGTNANNRLRIYVPEGKVDFYKALFSNYQDYIYPTGYIVGSFINTPIPYDIGEYSVREATVKDRNNQDVNGWEIIEYHGADISNTFNIPLTYTINGVTKDVIAVGDHAFKHTTVNGSGGSDIVNNKLMKLGDHSFEGITAIKSFTSTSLLDIGSYAFNNGGLVYLETPNLRSIGSYALANMNTLYKINLGSVYQMDTNAVYALPNLVQIFFTPGSETRIFDQYAFTDVGTLTNNRIRFYVGSSNTSTEVKTPNNVNINVTDSCSRSQRGNGTSRRYTYVCTVTVRNDSGHDIEAWTTSVTLGNTTLQTATNALYEASSSRIVFNNTSSNGTLTNGSSTTFSYTVRTTNSSTWTNLYGHLSSSTGTYYTTTITTSTDYLTDVYANSFRKEYKDYFYDYGTIMGTYSSTNIPYNIGEYSVVSREYITKDNQSVKGLEIVEYHGADLNATYMLPTTLAIDGQSYEVIGVGERAFRWVTMSSGSTFDIVNTNLRYIGNYAFYNLQGVRELNLSNVDYIGEYALFNNKLYKSTTPKLVELGNYAYANNITLNYVNAGPVTSIGEGAFYGCTGMEQMFFTSTNADTQASGMKIGVGSNAFYNVGTTIGKRFRIYVPDGKIGTSNVTYQEAYKNTFPSNVKDYIYPTGYIIGSYKFGTLPYDIGEYSIREVTLKNMMNADVTGWEIIEYHGPDVTSSFEIPNEITAGGITHDVVSIGTYAYYGVEVVTGQTWVVNLPNSVVLIDDYAFYQTDVTRVTGNQITRLGKYSFADCEKLTNAIFNSVVVADDYCLYSCGSISYIQFGTGTTDINDYALYNPYQGGPTTTLSMQVNSVPNTASNALPGYERGFLGLWYNSHFTYSVPSSVLSDFRNATPWSYHNYSSAQYSSDFLYILNNNNEIKITSYTGSSASVTIPDTLDVNGRSYNVTSITADAFDGNRYVTTLKLPRYLDDIPGGFLDGNSNISNINVDANNATFSSTSGVLYNKDASSLIRYPNGKTAMTFTVPSTVKTIGYRAFANQTNINTIYMNNILESIGAYAFNGCTNLSTYYFYTDVPKLTGFDTFDTSYQLQMYVPTDYISNYRSNTYFKAYSNYLVAN